MSKSLAYDRHAQPFGYQGGFVLALYINGHVMLYQIVIGFLLLTTYQLESSANFTANLYGIDEAYFVQAVVDPHYRILELDSAIF